MRVRSPWLGLLLLSMILGSCAFSPLLSGAKVTPETISPNADGTDDVARITYQIARPSEVSIYFTDQAEHRYYFRQDERRSPGKYEVYWSGVIDAAELRRVPGGAELVDRRVMPAGVYRWGIDAVEVASRQPTHAEGRITIQDPDTALPDITNFSVVPGDFSPNQDSIHDEVSVSYYLTKQVERIRVWLEPARVDPNGPALRYPITEDPTATKAEPGAVGYHGYKYRGGVDLNAVPPPDGDYLVKVEAEDKVGNRATVSGTLSIHEGGKPLAEVAGGEIDWQGEMNRGVGVPLGQTLCFTSTVINIGPVPIRTAGPWPGQLYRFTENNNTLAQHFNEPSWYQQAGSWRFGVNFDTTGVDFPFRWAIGRPEDLDLRVIDGQPQFYLLPGHRGHVFGCIQFDQKPPSGTQFWWGGLIHEFVAVTNDQINRIEVKVGAP